MRVVGAGVHLRCAAIALMARAAVRNVMQRVLQAIERANRPISQVQIVSSHFLQSVTSVQWHHAPSMVR